MKTTSKKLKTSARQIAITCMLTLIISANVTVAFAQERWGFTIRGGADFPTAKLGDADLKTRFGFEGAVSYRFLSHLYANAGWSWNKFNSDQSFAGANIDFEETGYFAGLQFIHPIGESRFSYLVGAAFTYNHIETENKEGEIIDDSGHGFGYQVDAGVSIKLIKRLQLVPSVRYRSLSRTIKIAEQSTPVDLNYIAGQLGLTWNF
jgi:opacity protein-like surface antigen